MNAGKLRHRVIILAPVASRDTYGENLHTWTPVLTVWASIQQLRGVLLALAQARTSTAIATHCITVRYNAAINENQRVQFGPALSQDFDSLTGTEFDAMDSTVFDAMTGTETGNPPVIYTITSILDPDTRRRQMNLLCVAVKA